MSKYKYVFDVSQILSTTPVEIIAKSREDAEEKIQEMINDNKIFFPSLSPEYQLDLAWSHEISPIEEAISIIESYYKAEFGEDHSPVDRAKLDNIGLAYTSFQDEPERFGDSEEHFIQVCVDLVAPKPAFFYYQNNSLIKVDMYDSIEELIERELRWLDFNDLTTRYEKTEEP